MEPLKDKLLQLDSNNKHTSFFKYPSITQVDYILVMFWHGCLFTVVIKSPPWNRDRVRLSMIYLVKENESLPYFSFYEFDQIKVTNQVLKNTPLWNVPNQCYINPGILFLGWLTG